MFSGRRASVVLERVDEALECGGGMKSVVQVMVGGVARDLDRELIPTGFTRSLKRATRPSPIALPFACVRSGSLWRDKRKDLWRLCLTACLPL